MKTIEVHITLKFNQEGAAGGNIPRTNGVPWTLIVESLNSLSKGMCEQLVKEAQGDVKDEEVEGYLDGMIALDRIKLKELFK